jgi:hypothetical protein
VLDDERVEEWALNGLVVLFYLPVVLGSLLYLFWSGGEFALWVRTLGEHRLRDGALGLGVGLGLIAATRAFARLPPGRAMADALGRAIGTPALLTCVILAVCSASGEELLFRAVLQPRVGIAVASVLFAAAHPPYERALWPWPLVALPMGFAFGGLYELTGAALAGIVAHAALYAANLWWIGQRLSAASATGSARSSPGARPPPPPSGP